MDHNVTLITTIASGFCMALILGFIAERLRIPALVGYLVAGILIGPSTPGFVADVQIASQLSEIGVMLLMFGVGLHFSLNDLMAVKRIAIPGALVQMTLATLMGIGITWQWGWSLGSGLIFGLCLSCASTVVLLKALEARGVLESMNGRIAVGWLVIEDLVCVLVLVLLPPLSGILGGHADAATASIPLWKTVSQTLLQVAAFIALMMVAGRRVVPWLLWQISKTGSRELFTLAVITAAIGIAYGAAQLFSVSFALGAFFAGMVMRESKFSHRAAQESLPLRDAFSVLFFVAVGMLFRPLILVEQPLHVLMIVAIIMVGKSLAAGILVLACRYPLNTALTVAASLAQIGEFSFILGGLGVSLSLLPAEGMSLVLAGSLISIALNPVLFALIAPFKRWILQRSELARHLEDRESPSSQLPRNTDRKYLQDQTVLVGYGRMGKRIATVLDSQKIPYIVAEQNRELVDELRLKGVPAISGDATDMTVQARAYIENAAMLIVATNDPINSRQIAATAQELNPNIEIVAWAHTEDELQLMREENFGTVFYGEDELIKGMTEHVISRLHPEHAIS